MKLHLDRGDGKYQIKAYNTHSITVNETLIEHSILIMPNLLKKWEITNFDNLTTADFTHLSTLNPELILLGTGERIRFPHPALLAELMQHNIGVEAMDTRAACRTYNILLGEGRNVLAALILTPPH